MKCMKTRAIAIGIASVLIFSGAVPIKTVKAAEDINQLTDEVEIDISDRTEGLIYQYYVTVSTSNGKLVVNAKTRSDSTMYKIGFYDVSIERSSDNYNWTQESYQGNKYTYYSSSYTLSDYNFNVVGGYHYRVSLRHYADNGSGTTQSIDNTSNSVWIS